LNLTLLYETPKRRRLIKTTATNEKKKLFWRRTLLKFLYDKRVGPKAKASLAGWLEWCGMEWAKVEELHQRAGPKSHQQPQQTTTQGIKTGNKIFVLYACVSVCVW